MTLSLITSTHEQRRIGPPQLGPPGESGVLLDAVIEEGIDHGVSVTSFPVELGADISDHAILEPQRYTMRGVVSDIPITWRSTEYEHIDAKTRSLSAYALLRDLQIAREPFAIETGFLRYESMVIERLTASKDTSRENHFDFSAQLIQVRIVENQVSVITPEQLQEGQAREQGGPVADKGRQSGQPTTSLAVDIVDGLTGAVSGLFP